MYRVQLTARAAWRENIIDTVVKDTDRDTKEPETKIKYMCICYSINDHRRVEEMHNREKARDESTMGGVVVVYLLHLVS